MTMSPNLMPTGVLTDKWIQQSCQQADKLIANFANDHVQACSYDMRIGTVFRRGRIIKWTSSDEFVTLEPGEIICLLTHEELLLPPDILATAFPMNTLSSQGLLVLNPGHIDPGYRGPLSVRLINIRSTPKNICLGDAIFTVIFEKLSESVIKPFDKNESRSVHERKYAALDLEQNPGSLGEMIVRGNNPPFLSKEQVENAIRDHWATVCIFIFTLIAAVTGGVLVVLEFLKKVH